MKIFKSFLLILILTACTTAKNIGYDSDVMEKNSTIMYQTCMQNQRNNKDSLETTQYLCQCASKIAYEDEFHSVFKNGSQHEVSARINSRVKQCALEAGSANAQLNIGGSKPQLSILGAAALANITKGNITTFERKYPAFQGCCSYHNGVREMHRSGRLICMDNQFSPTCAVDTRTGQRVNIR